MASNDDQFDIETLYCCASIITKHFVESPITLSCSHSVCKKCILAETVYCEKCETECKVDLNDLNESFPLKTLLSMHFQEMIEIQNKRYNELFAFSESSISSIK
jgi:hypothetical protein